MHDYYDEVSVGECWTFGTYAVTREEILDFADQYDPQPIHTEPAAARESPFGGLIASGWHTASMTMRLIVDNYLATSGAIGSPGVDKLRWPEPVRPGDVLSVTVEPVETTPWSDDVGQVTIDTTTVTDTDDIVMAMDALVLFPRREADE